MRIHEMLYVFIHVFIKCDTYSFRRASQHVNADKRVSGGDTRIKTTRVTRRIHKMYVQHDTYESDVSRVSHPHLRYQYSYIHMCIYICKHI